MKKILLPVLPVLLLLVSGCGKNSETESAAETVRFQVEGMTCQGCVDTIIQAVGILPGVNSCRVSLKNKSAVVDYQSGVLNPEQIQKRIEQLGYQARLPAP